MLESLRSMARMLTLEQVDCEAYCREKRYERYERFGGRVRFLRLHVMAHRILIPLLKLGLRFSGSRLVVLRDARRKSDRPVIYCPTHIGGMDVEMAFAAVGSPCWFVLGDPREFYRNATGMALQMNGVIPFDTREKRDRSIAKAQMAALLNRGGSLLLFPEGAQNISPNVLVSPLFAGAVELAITCGAEIVPIALERDGDTYYCVIGENVSYAGRTLDERFSLTDELRDRMATLKWEIIEKLPRLRRCEVTPQAYDDFLGEVTQGDEGYTWSIEDIVETRFHPKGVTSPEEAFASLHQLVPRKENAFLMRGLTLAAPDTGADRILRDDVRQRPAEPWRHLGDS